MNTTINKINANYNKSMIYNISRMFNWYGFQWVMNKPTRRAVLQSHGTIQYSKDYHCLTYVFR